MATVNGNNNSTTSAYSYLQFKNKIGGLVSGMDIDSIMEKLMKAQSAQMEKLQQQKQKYEWKRDAYREVNTKLNTYQQDLFDKYALKSSWNAKSATVSDNSSVTVKAGTAASGNLSISQIVTAKSAQSEFANNTVKVSTTEMNNDTKLEDIGIDLKKFNLFEQKAKYKDSTSSTTVGTLETMGEVIDVLKDNGYNATIDNGKMTIKLGDKTTPLDSETKSSLEALGFTFSKTEQQSDVLKLNENTIATGSTSLEDVNLHVGNIKIGDKEIDLSSIPTTKDKATVDDLLQKIKDEGFNASLSSEGRLVISTKDKSEIEVTSTNSDLQNKFTASMTNTISKKFVESIDSPSSVMTGSHTIQDLMGGDISNIGAFTINAIQANGKMQETEISFKGSDTIDSLISKINSSNAGVTALFHEGQFSISANNTGNNKDGAEISIITSLTQEQQASMTDSEKSDWDILHGAGNNLISKLTGLTVPSNGEEMKLADGGKNASMIVNGVRYEQESNVFSIAGYEIKATQDFNLGNETDGSYALASTTNKINISSTVDTDKTIDKVKEFVTMYNDLIAEINKKTTEKRNVDYSPLTDAQKAEMNESQIEKWEEKAKAGLLKGDTTLTNVLSKMRQTLFNYGTSSVASNSKEGTTPVGIKGETLASIGISTSKTWSDNGKLEIDEDKLRAALEKDPDIVSRIFTGDGTKENPGVISQLRTTAQDAVKTIEKSAGKDTSASDTSYSIGKTINSLSTKIDDWKERLKDIEERYWNQFSAMETAIQKANNQSSIFAQ